MALFSQAPKKSEVRPKRSTSVGAAFRSMFSRSGEQPETVPSPWTGSVTTADIADAIEKQGRASSANSSFPNSPLGPPVGDNMVQTQERGRPPTLESNTPSPAARFFTPSVKPTKTNANPIQHLEGVIIDKGSPRASSSAMAMQSHRGGPMEVVPTATATHATQHMTTTSLYHAETQRNEPNISSSTASDPDQQRGSHEATADTTSVTINYAEPPGQRYLPVVLYESVTMVQIGEHNGLPVYEPVNDFLRSPEDGLRYHKTMDYSDVYHGPLDIAVWGRPVIGPLSDNQMWLINPLSYDPTRPRPQPSYEHAETQEYGALVPTYHYASPDGDAQVMGDYAARHDDVDISLLAELGQAVPRGSADVENYPGTRTSVPTAPSDRSQLGEIPIENAITHKVDMGYMNSGSVPLNSGAARSARSFGRQAAPAAIASFNGTGPEFMYPISTL